MSGVDNGATNIAVDVYRYGDDTIAFSSEDVTIVSPNSSCSAEGDGVVCDSTTLSSLTFSLAGSTSNFDLSYRDYTDETTGAITATLGNGNDWMYILSAVPATVYGNAGNDRISSGDGNDTLYGDAGQDILDAGNGDDHAYGGTGNDAFESQVDDGADSYDGGANNLDPWFPITGYFPGDTVSYAFRTTPVTATLPEDSVSSPTGDNGGAGEHDMFAHIENLEGSDGVNVFTGNSGDNRLVGGDAADVLNGGSGKDSVDGRWGLDVLDGGPGDDSVDGWEINDSPLKDFVDQSLACGSGYDTVYYDTGDPEPNADCEVKVQHSGNNGGGGSNGGTTTTPRVVVPDPVPLTPTPPSDESFGDSAAKAAKLLLGDNAAKLSLPLGSRVVVYQPRMGKALRVVRYGKRSAPVASVSCQTACTVVAKLTVSLSGKKASKPTTKLSGRTLAVSKKRLTIAAGSSQRISATITGKKARVVRKAKRPTLWLTLTTTIDGKTSTASHSWGLDRQP